MHPDWSSDDLAPFKDAMGDPALFADALKALSRYGSRWSGEELRQDPAMLARQSHLRIAVDWVIFVLGMAGSDLRIARHGCFVLVNASTALPPDARHLFLRAAAPVLDVMLNHPMDARVQAYGASLLRSMSRCASARGCETLRQLGVEEVVRAAVRNHPGDAKLRCTVAYILLCLKH